MAKRPKSNRHEHLIAAALDERAAFEDFKDSVLPFLRKCLENGMTAEEIQAHPKLQAAMLARQMSIALKEVDSGKALAAIKDMRDRSEGKARERLEVTSKLERTPDDQLNALIKSKLALLDKPKEETESDESDDDFV